MTTDKTEGSPHPEDLLSMYALASLPDETAREVEAHVEACPSCQTELALLEETAAWLGASAVTRTPPEGIRTSLMEQVSRGQPEAPVAAPPGESRFRLLPGSWFRPAGLLAPIAASLALVLVVSVAANIYFDGKVDQLSENNARLTARLVNMSHNDTNLVGFLKDADISGYLLDNPSSEPLMLLPPGGEGVQQGVLLVAEDSRRAVLLVANMAQPNGQRGYHVWLWRPDERVRMGEMYIDSQGHGSMALYYPNESVLGFEKVFLSMPSPDNDAITPGDMVLEGSISAFNRAK